MSNLPKEGISTGASTNDPLIYKGYNLSYELFVEGETEWCITHESCDLLRPSEGYNGGKRVE
jgi:hypothetical protein